MSEDKIGEVKGCGANTLQNELKFDRSNVPIRITQNHSVRSNLRSLEVVSS